MGRKRDILVLVLKSCTLVYTTGDIVPVSRH